MRRDKRIVAIAFIVMWNGKAGAAGLVALNKMLPLIYYPERTCPYARQQKGLERVSCQIHARAWRFGEEGFEYVAYANLAGAAAAECLLELGVR